MSRTNDLWLERYEDISERFIAGEINEDEVRAKMERLGLDPHLIEDHLDAKNISDIRKEMDAAQKQRTKDLIARAVTETKP